MIKVVQVWVDLQVLELLLRPEFMLMILVEREEICSMFLIRFFIFVVNTDSSRLVVTYSNPFQHFTYRNSESKGSGKQPQLCLR